MYYNCVLLECTAALDSLAHENLGCHVAGGAALCGQAAIRHGLLRKPEVRHLDHRIIRLAHQQQVLRLTLKKKHPNPFGVRRDKARHGKGQGMASTLLPVHCTEPVPLRTVV